MEKVPKTPGALIKDHIDKREWVDGTNTGNSYVVRRALGRVPGDDKKKKGSVQETPANDEKKKSFADQHSPARLYAPVLFSRRGKRAFRCPNRPK